VQLTHQPAVIIIINNVYYDMYGCIHWNVCPFVWSQFQPNQRWSLRQQNFSCISSCRPTAMGQYIREWSHC